MSCFLLTALLIVSAQMQTPSETPSKPPAPAVKTAAGSTSAKEQSPAAAKSAKPAALDPSDAVITIHGLCSSNQAGQSAESCTTVVTRKQFDALIRCLDALGPPLLPTQRRSVAEGYATTLRNYEAAKKAGVEKDPRYPEVMRIAQMRAMGDMYNALMQEKA